MRHLRGIDTENDAISQIYWIILVKDEQGLNVQPHHVHSRRASMLTRASEPHNYVHMDLETGFTIGAHPVCIRQG